MAAVSESDIRSGLMTALFPPANVGLNSGLPVQPLIEIIVHYAVTGPEATSTVVRGRKTARTNTETPHDSRLVDPINCVIWNNLTSGKNFVLYLTDDRLRSVNLSSGEVDEVVAREKIRHTRTVSYHEHSFLSARGIAVHPTDNYILVSEQHRISKVASGGGSGRSPVSVLAGSQSHGRADGVGTMARFDHPESVCFSPDGERCFVVDVANSVIRTIVVATATVSGAHSRKHAPGLHGLALQPYIPPATNSGTATTASTAVAPPPVVVFVTQYGTHLMRFTMGKADTPGVYIPLSRPVHIIAMVFVAPTVILATTRTGLSTIDSDTGRVTHVCGSSSGYTDGPNDFARFGELGGVCFDEFAPNGQCVYVCDRTNSAIRCVELPRRLFTPTGGAAS